MKKCIEQYEGSLFVVWRLKGGNSHVCDAQGAADEIVRADHARHSKRSDQGD